jgi:quercetin dioxygenase-like cupin family protein
MKTNKLISISVLCGLFLFFSININAQDPAKVALTEHNKVLIDNEKVKVIEVVFAPGESTEWHSHPDHIAYAVTDGKIEITDKDKPSTIADLKAGDAMYIPAVTHKVKNLGTAAIKILVTELKTAGSKNESSNAGK